MTVQEALSYRPRFWNGSCVLALAPVYRLYAHGMNWSVVGVPLVQLVCLRGSACKSLLGSQITEEV